MTNKTISRRKIKIKALMRYCIPVRMVAKIFKMLTISVADKEVEQLKLSDGAGGNAKWETTLENSLAVSYLIKHTLIT